jgi:hypothetical protein
LAIKFSELTKNIADAAKLAKTSWLSTFCMAECGIFVMVEMD